MTSTATANPTGAPGGAAAVKRGRPAAGLAAAYLLGSLAYAAAQWGVLVLLARFGGLADVGRFAAGLALVSPVTVLANLQLRSLVATDALRRHAWDDYATLRTAATLLGVAGVVALTRLFGCSWEVTFIAWSLALAKAFEARSELVHGVLQRAGRLDRVGLSLMLKAGLTVAAFAATFLATGSTVLATATLPIVWGAVLVGHDHRRRELAEFVSTRPQTTGRLALAPLVLLALPAAVGTAFGSLQTNVPRYFVEGLLGPEALGVFAALAYVAVIGNLCAGSVNQTALPRLARSLAEGDLPAADALTSRLLKLAIGLGAVVVIAAAVAGKPLLWLLYGGAVAEHHRLFLGVAAAQSVRFVSQALEVGLRAERRLWPIAKVRAGALAVALSAAVALIPTLGLTGAVLGLFVASSAECLLTVQAARSARRDHRQPALLPTSGNAAPPLRQAA